MVLSGFILGGMLSCVGIGFVSSFANGVFKVPCIKQAPAKNRARTLLDITSVQDAKRLVCLFGKYHYGGDEIADTLYDAYRSFPPDKNTMKQLSLLYEEYMGAGGVEEYAVTLLYRITLDVSMRTEEKKV